MWHLGAGDLDGPLGAAAYGGDAVGATASGGDAGGPTSTVSHPPRNSRGVHPTTSSVTFGKPFTVIPDRAAQRRDELRSRAVIQPRMIRGFGRERASARGLGIRGIIN